jgi:sulfopyruvate decarboxylase subunit beta
MIRRDLAFRILARHVRGEIIVPVYQAAQEWRAVNPDYALTYYSIGAMGQASSAALGLALGRPDKRVIVLDGDGSLLMNLGTLVTIANEAPKNLVHFVCENGMYEANGGHPIPGKSRLSFAGLARAAGYAKTFEFAELAAFEAGIAQVLAAEGPVFATLKLVPGEPPPQDYAFIHGPDARQRFRAALKG